MEPFAYDKKEPTNYRKLVLVLLAGASFSIWLFDLVPEFESVSTGSLDVDVTDPDLGEDDFLKLLGANDTSDQPLDTTDPGTASPAEADPLLAALARQSEPLEESDGSEFGSMSPLPSPDGPPSSIQQVAFEQSQPPDISFEPPQPVLPASVASHIQDVDKWIQEGETLEAHVALSRLYWKQPDIRQHLLERLQKTSAEIYANPDTHFAEPRTVFFGETLESIAREYKVPWQYLANLNSVTPETLQAGQKLKVLTGPFGAAIDLKNFEMTITCHGWYVHHYRIGIGKDGGTPTGTFTVQNKLENPTWHNPDGGIVDADDPTNPLGEYWLGLGDRIGIHGTIEPESIGRASSRGCIHLADGDIAEVFQLLGPGSPVVIRD